jgi:tRNA(fMet)-specific endonuclease VapC
LHYSGANPEPTQVFFSKESYGSATSRLYVSRLGENFIDPHDLLIAAHAVHRNLILVTNNQFEFSRVQRLRLENWLE